MSCEKCSELEQKIKALSTFHATALREAEIAAVRRGAEMFHNLERKSWAEYGVDNPISIDDVVAAYKRETANE